MSTWKQMELCLHLTTHTKIFSTWVWDQDVKVKELKHLEDNIEEYLYDICLEFFLNRLQKY